MNQTQNITRKSAIQAARKIDGWLTDQEAGALFDLAFSAKGPIVEVGSHFGRSTSALALGSMAGNGHPVYAVDSFIGVAPSDRVTANGVNPGWGSSSPEILRANLDKVGVNGLVKIVAKPSSEALADLPEQIGAVFIDGDHSKEAATADLVNYLGRLQPGGSAMIHDVTPHDPGVVEAVDDVVMAHAGDWRLHGRVDSAIVITKTKQTPRSVCVAFPGVSFCPGTVQGALQMSLSGIHSLQSSFSSNGFDDFNIVWAQALNAFEAGSVTHFAMLHSDVVPQPGWLDVLLGEIEELKADVVSCVIPIKDGRGVTSTGIGNPACRWAPFRRFTMHEIMEMPSTFSISDTEYPDKFLLHNTGCWVCDLRSPIFRQTDKNGNAECYFNFPTAVRRGEDGRWVHYRESEDWFFSKKLAKLGAKTYATRKVSLFHRGAAEYSNHEAWGAYKNGDEDTRVNWDPDFKSKSK